MNKEKGDWHITWGTAGNNINNVVERVMTERLPVCIDEVIVYKNLNPHDVDFLFVKRKPQPEDYKEAEQIFLRLIEYFHFNLNRFCQLWTPNITMKLIRRGIKGVNLSNTIGYNLLIDTLLEFVRYPKDKEKLFKSGFLVKVVWSSSWEGDLPRDKEHPLLPYLRFMRMINNAGIYGSMKKIDERIKDLSVYNGGDWKVLLNKEEMQCYEDVIREQ